MGALTVLLMGPAAADCMQPGVWQAPGADRLEPRAWLAELADASVVLMGERHGQADYHRWQLHTLAALRAHQPDLAIGLEMLPRAAQPALDRWVEGELTADALLEAVDWDRVWGHDPDHYLPVLRFARHYGIPLIALNIDRSLSRRVGREGWAAVPPAERAGIDDPAPPPDAYRERLRRAYERHRRNDADAEADFQRFVDVQLLWDRAMAEALAGAMDDAGLVVGLMGDGHVAYGHGVPHQLADLDVTPVISLMAVRPDCSDLEPGLADAVFMLPPEPTDP